MRNAQNSRTYRARPWPASLKPLCGQPNIVKLHAAAGLAGLQPANQSPAAPEPSGRARERGTPTSRATIPAVPLLISSRLPCHADSIAGRDRVAVSASRRGFRASSRIYYILLGISFVLPTSKKICQVKKNLFPIV